MTAGARGGGEEGGGGAIGLDHHSLHTSTSQNFEASKRAKRESTDNFDEDTTRHIYVTTAQTSNGEAAQNATVQHYNALLTFPCLRNS